MVATTKTAKQVYHPTRTGYLIERYIASFLQLSGSKGSEDRENYSQAIDLLSAYARRHNFPSISLLLGINNHSNPFTCFEMYNALGNLWINTNGGIELSDENTAEGLRKILLQVFARHEIADVEYGIRDRQPFPMLMNGWDKGKMDKTLTQIIQ